MDINKKKWKININKKKPNKGNWVMDVHLKKIMDSLGKNREKKEQIFHFRDFNLFKALQKQKWLEKQPSQFIWRDLRVCRQRWVRKKAGWVLFKPKKKKKKKWLRWWQKKKKYRIPNSKYALRRIRLYNKWSPHPKFKKFSRIKFYFKKSLGLIFGEKEKVIERVSKNVLKKKKKVKNFLKNFECRLDTTLHRSSFASLKVCKQWINDGLILINNKTKNKSNLLVKENQIISVSEKGMPIICDTIVKRFEKTFWRIDVRKGHAKKPRGFHRKKYRRYRRFKFSRIPWSKFFLYFNNYPKHLITNFTTLTTKYIKGAQVNYNFDFNPKFKKSRKIAHIILSYYADRA